MATLRSANRVVLSLLGAIALSTGFGLGWMFRSLEGSSTHQAAIGVRTWGAPGSAERYPHAVFEFNRGAPQTLYLFGQCHPTPEAPPDPECVLASQGFIGLTLDRLIVERRVGAVLGEGVRHPDHIPFEPTIDLSPEGIEATLRRYPAETAYTLLKRKHGSGLRLLASGEADYPGSGWDLASVNNRSRVFLFDLAGAFRADDSVAAVIGLAHIPAILSDIQNGSVVTKEGNREVGRLSRPHVIAYLTGTEFRAEATFVIDRLSPDFAEIRPGDGRSLSGTRSP